MSRSKWKNLFFDLSLIKKMYLVEKKELILKKNDLYSRKSNIPEILEEEIICIHNGKDFNSVIPNELIESKKFGEFASTRKPFYYPSKKDKKKK